jgi:hypothetical protein
MVGRRGIIQPTPLQVRFKEDEEEEEEKKTEIGLLCTTTFLTYHKID